MIKINTFDKFNLYLKKLQDGLDPKIISYWYDVIIQQTKELASPRFADRINVKQDQIISVKFNINIPKHAIYYFMISLHNNLQYMLPSTRLYFLKVIEIVDLEINKSYK